MNIKVIKNLNNDVDSKDVIKNLKDDGVVVVNSFLDKNYILDFRSELFSIYNQMKPNYQFGKIIRSDDKSLKLEKIPIIADFFKKNLWMKEIIKNYMGDQAVCHRDFFFII